jgi:HEAT repeat protein
MTEQRLPAAAWDILALLEDFLGGGLEERETITARIGSLLADLPIEDLPELDQLVRSAFDSYRWGGLSLRPADVPALERVRGGAAVLGTASFHPSGYVREAAVAELAGIRSGEELPFLLLRLNDWVDPVRRRALAAVRERIEPSYASDLANNLALVIRLEGCGRAAHGDIVRAVEDLLILPACRGALLEGLRSAGRRVRRRCARLLDRIPPAEALDLSRGLIASPDPGLRAEAAVLLLRGLEGDELRRMIEALKGDRFMAIRREALVALARKFPESAAEDLRRALLDDRPAVRDAARFLLRERGMTDFAGLYREAIRTETGRARAAAIHGLGETGGPPDLSFAIEGLADPAPRVRRAAVAACSRLGEDPAPLLGALGDPSQGVSGEARKALVKWRRRILAGKLGPLLDPGSHRHVRLNALRILGELDKWELIPGLLLAACDRDPAVAALALDLVRGWLAHFNRSATRPAGDQRERLESALRTVEGRLAPDLVREMMFLIEALRR